MFLRVGTDPFGEGDAYEDESKVCVWDFAGCCVVGVSLHSNTEVHDTRSLHYVCTASQNVEPGVRQWRKKL